MTGLFLHLEVGLAQRWQSTGRTGGMAHRKWKEIKKQPGTAGPGNLLGCYLVSFHFLWVIHSIRPVESWALHPQITFKKPLQKQKKFCHVLTGGFPCLCQTWLHTESEWEHAFILLSRTLQARFSSCCSRSRRFSERLVSDRRLSRETAGCKQTV